MITAPLAARARLVLPDSRRPRSFASFTAVLPELAATRVLLVAMMLAARYLLPLGPGAAAQATWQAPPWLRAFAGWDGAYYFQIARDGYTAAPGVLTAFPPLYPLLMRLVGRALGGSDTALLLAGVGISNMALLVALCYLLASAAPGLGEQAARRAALYLLVFPSSIFLSAIYPHALFLAVCLAALFHARRGQWWLAGLCAAAAALTRADGIAIVAPLAWEAWRQGRLRGWLATAAAPAAYLAWLAYLWRTTGDPLASTHAQAAWQRQLAPPWQSFQHLLSGHLVLHGYDHSLLELCVTLAFTVLVVVAWRRTRTAEALFGTSLLAIMLSSGLLISTLRYVLDIFPAFEVLATFGARPLVHRGLLLGMGTCALLFGGLFAVGYWVA